MANISYVRLLYARQVISVMRGLHRFLVFAYRYRSVMYFNQKGDTIMDTRELVESYHNAWTSGDFGTARELLADDLDFRGSVNTFTNADDFIAVLSHFRGILRGVKLLRSFFDDQGAALLYDCDTVTSAGILRTAEFITVSENRITEIRLVFDATELRKAMQAEG
jgi:hypothetical protein